MRGEQVAGDQQLRAPAAPTSEQPKLPGLGDATIREIRQLGNFQDSVPTWVPSIEFVGGRAEVQARSHVNTVDGGSSERQLIGELAAQFGKHRDHRLVADVSSAIHSLRSKEPPMPAEDIARMLNIAMDKAGLPKNQRIQLSQDKVALQFRENSFHLAGPRYVVETASRLSEIGNALRAVPGRTDGQRVEGWTSAKKDINAYGRNPTDAAIELFRDSRVAIIGHQHLQQGNSLEAWLSSAMESLRDEAGLTHIALELPSSLSPVFDKFNRGAGHLEVPETLVRSDGSVDDSPDAHDALRTLKLYRDHWPGFNRLIEAARAAGVQVVAIDHPQTGNPGIESQRNKVMADNIAAITQTEGTKVLGLLGFAHVFDSRGNTPNAPQWMTPGTTAGELLRSSLQSRGEKVSLLFAEIGNNDKSLTSLYPFAPVLTEAVMVPTRNPNGQPNAIGQIKMVPNHDHGMPYTFDSYDRVLIFPPNLHQIMDDHYWINRWERR